MEGHIPHYSKGQWWVIISVSNFHQIYVQVTLNVIITSVLSTEIWFIPVTCLLGAAECLLCSGIENCTQVNL
jgi:hypothetical protein